MGWTLFVIKSIFQQKVFISRKIVGLQSPAWIILWPSSLSFCDESNLSLSAREGSGLSSGSRSTNTDLLIGQSAALYLNHGACDHNNNFRRASLDWIFANQGCFWHRFASSQSKTLDCIMERKDVILSTKTDSDKIICYRSGPFMLQFSDDSHRHTITHGRHTHIHMSQCEVGVRQYNQWLWHWQSGQVSYPGGANPVECLNINVKLWKLEFRAWQEKPSEAWSEGCAIWLLVRTTVIVLLIKRNIGRILDLDRQEEIGL